MSIKTGISLFLAILFLFGAAGILSAKAEQKLNPDGYELHFLLNSELALDESHQLKQELREEYKTGDKVKSYRLVYFETADRAFSSEGWVNRLRRKDGGKKGFELTYKKRYTVSGEDISAAMRLAELEGFDLSDENWETEIEWGYSGMTLSVSTESNFSYGGYVRIDDLDPTSAAATAARLMPAEEQNWKEEGWGSSQMAVARMAGPISFNRYTGTAFGREVQIEVWKMHGQDGEANLYITELSFKAENYEDAATSREAITAGLAKVGLLIPDDALKTQQILNAYFNEFIQ